jgi:hypothetical protein
MVECCSSTSTSTNARKRPMSRAGTRSFERRLHDGSTFRVIKNFVDPDRLELRLRRLGWDCTIRRDGSDWVRGEVRLAR